MCSSHGEFEIPRTRCDLVLCQHTPSTDDLFKKADLQVFQGRIERVEKKPLNEEYVVERVRWAITNLKAKGQPPTQRAISKLAQIARNQLKIHPKVKELLEQASIEVGDYYNEQKKAQSEEVYKQMQLAVKQLEDIGKPVTETNICRLIGISRGQLSRLKGFPKVQAFLGKSINQYHVRRKGQDQFEGDSLKMEVEAVIEDLIARKQRLTRTAISKAVGVPVSKLQKYAQIRDIFMQNVPTTKLPQFEEDKLIEKIEDVVRQLKDSGQIITQRNVAKLIGISASGFYYYPRAKAVIDEHASWYHNYVRRQHEKTGDEIFVRVKNAINQLRDNGQLVTQYTIGSILEISPYILKGYYQVRVLLEQFEEGYCQHLTEESSLREEQLFDKVKATAAYLLSRNELVTPHTVGKVMNVNPSVLYYYSRIRMYFKSMMNDESENKNLREKIREDMLVLEVMDALEYLRQQGQGISIRSITKIIGVSRSVLVRYPRTREILAQVVSKSQRRPNIEIS